MPRFTGFVPGRGKTAIPPVSPDAIRPGMTSFASSSGRPAAGGGAGAGRVMRSAFARDAAGGRDGSGLGRVAARSGTPPAGADCAAGLGGRGASRITTMAPAATRQMSAAPRRRSCAARRTAGASTSRTPAASARGPGREGSLGIARPAIIWREVRRLQTRVKGSIRACSYPPGWRIAGAVLFAVSRASLPAILALVALASDPPVTPPMLVRAVVVFALLPGLAARLVARAFVASLSVDDDALVIRRRDLRLEVPYRAVARLAPWAVPLPGPGLSVCMRSGRRLRQGLQIDDPTPFLLALAETGGLEAARGAPRRWHHLLGRFAGFALLPTAVLFNAHQHIAYGGLLGEYYLLGLGSYVRTFAVHWLTLTIYLVLYASVWRGLAEGVALLAACAAPANAAGARRAVEIACQVAYYGGVPLLLLLRFLP